MLTELSIYVYDQNLIEDHIASQVSDKVFDNVEENILFVIEERLLTLAIFDYTFAEIYFKAKVWKE